MKVLLPTILLSNQAFAKDVFVNLQDLQVQGADGFEGEMSICTFDHDQRFSASKILSYGNGAIYRIAREDRVVINTSGMDGVSGTRLGEGGQAGGDAGNILLKVSDQKLLDEVAFINEPGKGGAGGPGLAASAGYITSDFGTLIQGGPGVPGIPSGQDGPNGLPGSIQIKVEMDACDAIYKDYANVLSLSRISLP